MSMILIVGLIGLVGQAIAASRDASRWETIQEVLLRGMK